MKSDGSSTISEYEAEALERLIGDVTVEFHDGTDLMGQGITAERSGKNTLLRKRSSDGKNSEKPSVPHVLSGHRGNIKRFWIDKWANFIVSSGEDSKVILWDVKTRKAVRTFEGNPKAVRFSDDETYLAIAEEDSLKQWNLKNQPDQPSNINEDVNRVMLFTHD